MKLLSFLKRNKENPEPVVPIRHDAGEDWDESDVTALIEYLNEGLDYTTIAEKMGRSRSAVGSKVYRLRNSGRLAP